MPVACMFLQRVGLCALDYIFKPEGDHFLDLFLLPCFVVTFSFNAATRNKGGIACFLNV